MKAAVVRNVNEIAIEDIDIPQPAAGEVLVRMVASGVCHTDLSLLRGLFPVAMPMVLGHEGSGIVEELGSGVTGVAVGDSVVLSMMVACGACQACLRGQPAICERGMGTALSGLMPDGTRRLRRGDETFASCFCQSSLAEYAVVPAQAVVPIRKDAPLETVAVLGCGAMTGIGAVTRRAQVRPGATVLVIGAGGVGLSAVMAARAAGATMIIAVDILDAKLDTARELGATHTVNSKERNVPATVQEIAGLGVDHAFDAVGADGTLEVAFQCLRPGGEAVAIGAVSVTNTCTVDFISLLMEKRLTGTYGGSIIPRVDIPAAVDLFMDGRLPLDRLVSRTYTLDTLGQLIEDMDGGRITKGVVTF